MEEVAKYLRFKVSCKNAVIRGQKVEYFAGEIALRSGLRDGVHMRTLRNIYIPVLCALGQCSNGLSARDRYYIARVH